MKTQEAILGQLTNQYEVTKLSEAKESSSFQVLDPAEAPTKKSKRKRSLIVNLATVTAFFISVFASFIGEFLERMSAEDRERLADIRKSLRSRI